MSGVLAEEGQNVSVARPVGNVHPYMSNALSYIINVVE